MNKTIRVAIILALSAGSIMAQTAPASAQWRDGPQRWDDRRGPPPPPPRRHRNNTGKVIAGGLAAGVIGGLIGGALANGNNNGPRYIEEPPPPPRPRCWYEDRRVGNSYDDGWHYENVRVCN